MCRAASMDARKVGNDTTPSTFAPGSGESFSVMAGYRDQVSGTSTQYRVLRPDGSVFSSWNQTASTTYAGAWWYWNLALPSNAPHGLWAFEATYQGVTTRHSFQVADEAPDLPGQTRRLMRHVPDMPIGDRLVERWVGGAARFAGA